MSFDPALEAHLKTGLTTTCRAWRVTRRDSVVYGFTDHDLDLSFDGTVFRADSGLSALALEQASGLSVDNTEAVGALRDDALTEADIAAGRFDGAEVEAWVVNWADPSARQVMFKGHLGEITRTDGAFRAELRGLSDLLNRPMGRVYQAPCSAVLGDQTCRFAIDQTGYHWQGQITQVEDNRVLILPALPDFATEWFVRGTVQFDTGAAAGLTGLVKRDTHTEQARKIDLTQALDAPIAAGDTITLIAGCDKRFETCRFKFNNALNFQGFPDVPAEDWVAIHPGSGGVHAGGSRR